MEGAEALEPGGAVGRSAQSAAMSAPTLLPSYTRSPRREAHNARSRLERKMHEFRHDIYMYCQGRLAISWRECTSQASHPAALSVEFISSHLFDVTSACHPASQCHQLLPTCIHVGKKISLRYVIKAEVTKRSDRYGRQYLPNTPEILSSNHHRLKSPFRALRPCTFPPSNSIGIHGQIQKAERACSGLPLGRTGRNKCKWKEKRLLSIFTVDRASGWPHDHFLRDRESHRGAACCCSAWASGPAESAHNAHWSVKPLPQPPVPAPSQALQSVIGPISGT